MTVELTLMLGSRTLSIEKVLSGHFGSRNLTYEQNFVTIYLHTVFHFHSKIEYLEYLLTLPFNTNFDL